MLAQQLLQNCLVYVNIQMVQKVLDETAWRRRMGPRDYKALTPLLTAHVSPYGSFKLTMNDRLPLAA